ncbi:MAG TPA: hypothetical protein VGO89_01790, partial [Streptomyces sp.]|nr:hypothetical protein [Streptomyces sp.]
MDFGGFDDRDSEGAEGVSDGAGSGGRCVEEDPGSAGGFFSDRGSVRGELYSVPSRTVCTPNQD